MEKSYKLVNNGSDKQIAYPIGMSDDLIAALETARKNKSFVTLTSGNVVEVGSNIGNLSLKSKNSPVISINDGVAKEIALKGDANNDGSIDMIDVTNIMSDLTSEKGLDADVTDLNGDGVVDMVDVTLLLEKLTEGTL